MDVRLQHMIYKPRDVFCMGRLVICSSGDTVAGNVPIIWIFSLRDCKIQERNFQERVMLIYDGIHYDALAVWLPYLFIPIDICMCMRVCKLCAYVLRL